MFRYIFFYKIHVFFFFYKFIHILSHLLTKEIHHRADRVDYIEIEKEKYRRRNFRG